MAGTHTIDTRDVNGRVDLRFQSIDEALACVEGLVESERRGRLQRMGNWTLGQSLGHLATWAEFAFAPVPLKPPLLIRLVLRPMKKRFLYKSMSAGRHIPRVPGGTLGIEAIRLDEGLTRFRNSFERLKEYMPTQRHVLFGTLTHDEWINAHLRHAELHLSFLRADCKSD